MTRAATRTLVRVGKPVSGHPFEAALSVAAEDICVELRAQCPAPWAEFILNPRRLRGSDFLMRWSQGVWSEERVVEAVNRTDSYFVLPYGPSGTAPHDDVREFELYFERLERAGLGQVKRPDLLVFRKSDRAEVQVAVRQIGGVRELPFTPEDDAGIKGVLSKAILAVECENSLWRASKMRDYGSDLKPQRRLGGTPGLRKSAVLPTVILKEEDRAPLRKWQNQRKVKIHIWQVFYDLVFSPRNTCDMPWEPRRGAAVLLPRAKQRFAPTFGGHLVTSPPRSASYATP